jgi:hypothetical protein
MPKPRMREFLALSISLIKRDKRGLTRVAETVSPLDWDVIGRISKEGDPSSHKLVDILNRLRASIGKAGDPQTMEEAIASSVRQATADDLQFLVAALRKGDPNVQVIVRDDYTTGIRLTSFVTKLPADAHVVKAKLAEEALASALSMVDSVDDSDY